MEQTIIVYFGKGEYSLSSKNIDRVTKAVEEYNSQNKWQWCCQDVLGINGNGKKGKRFGEIQKALSNYADDSKVTKLLDVMNQVVEKDENILIKNPRLSSGEKTSKKIEELKSRLSLIDNLTPEQIDVVISKLA